MGDILIGTCSWTDRALLASGWYPQGAHSAEGRLRHYATRFPLVEVDSTYYALPAARRSQQWVERTPPGFVFDVKAFSQMTGHPTRTGHLPRGREAWQAFLEGIEPLRAAGRLGSVLLQFPPWFAPGAGTRAALARCRELAGGVRLAVEFRHAGWLTAARRAETLALLRENGMALVAVDTAQGLPTSIPPVAEVTNGELSVVRLHGRSPEWGTGTKESRFRHRYVREELLPWLSRVRQLAAQTRAVHVLFNNCCGDAAVAAAELMQHLLTESADPAPAAAAAGAEAASRAQDDG